MSLSNSLSTMTVFLSIFVQLSAQDGSSDTKSQTHSSKLPISRILGTWHFTEEGPLKPERDELTFQSDGSFQLKTGSFNFWKFFSGQYKVKNGGIIVLHVKKKTTEFFDSITSHKVDVSYRCRLGTDLAGNLMFKDLTEYPKPEPLTDDQKELGPIGRVEIIGDDSVNIQWRNVYARHRYENRATIYFHELLNPKQETDDEPTDKNNPELALEILEFGTVFGSSILEEDGRPNWGYILGKSNLLQSAIRDDFVRKELTNIWIKLARKQKSILDNLPKDNSVFGLRRVELIKTNIKIELVEILKQHLMPDEIKRLAVAARVEYLKSHWLSELITKKANAELLKLTPQQKEQLNETETRCENEFVKMLGKLDESCSDEQWLKRTLDTRFLTSLEHKQQIDVHELVGDYLSVPLDVDELNHADPYDRTWAAKSLADFRYRNTGTAIRKRLEIEKDPDVICALHYALAAQGERSSVEFLIDSLKHSHEAVSYLPQVTGKGYGYNAVNYKNWLKKFTDKGFTEWVRRREFVMKAYREFTEIYRQVQNGVFFEFRNGMPKFVRRKPTIAEVRILTRTPTARAWKIYTRAIDIEHCRNGDRAATIKLLLQIINEYPDTYYVGPAEELISQLKIMMMEEAEFSPPKNLEALSLEKKIEFHIHNLRNCQSMSFYGTSNPGDESYSPAAALYEIGEKAYPALEALHNDQRLLRETHTEIFTSFRIYPDRRILRYSDAAKRIIRTIQNGLDGDVIILD